MMSVMLPWQRIMCLLLVIRRLHHRWLPSAPQKSVWCHLGLPHCSQILNHLSHQGSPNCQLGREWSALGRLVPITEWIENFGAAGRAVVINYIMHPTPTPGIRINFPLQLCGSPRVVEMSMRRKKLSNSQTLLYNKAPCQHCQRPCCSYMRSDVYFHYNTCVFLF